MYTSNWNISFERPAEEALSYIMRDEDALGYELLARLNKLKSNPYPNYFGEYTITCPPIESLRPIGEIRRLKYSDILKYRIFYFVDDHKEEVVVCEIIPRGTNKDTYDDLTKPHMIRIIAAYKKHFNIK